MAPKGIAAIILGKLKKSSEEDEDNDEDSVSYKMKYDDASKEILSAVEKKDPELLTHTLKDFIKMCLADDDDSYEEEEEE